VLNPNDDLTSTPVTWQHFCTIQLTIHVTDVNDNPPKFTAASTLFFSIAENSPHGTLVTQLLANDADAFLHRRFTYSLTANNTLFSIEPTSGLLTLSSSQLDRELTGDWVNLTVRATDAYGLFSDRQLAISVLDLNDNVPIFTQTRMFTAVQENLPVGSVVTRLQAVDPDNNPDVRYYLLPGVDSHKFALNTTTGDLSLTETLDYETRKSLVVHVAAFDAQLPNTSNNSVCQLDIDVLDLNDNRPLFNATSPTEVNIDENLPVNATALQLQAYDSDSSSRLEFRLIAGDEKQKFGVDLLSGRVFVRNSPDYEKPDERAFEIVVECSDGVHSERQVVRINVRDVNDNAPEFTRPNQTVVLRDSLPVNGEVTRLEASDLDFGDRLTFVLVEPPTAVFRLEANGSLILAGKVSGSDGAYLLRVRCYDSGKPVPLFAETWLRVKVADGASHEPQIRDMDVRVVTVAGLIKVEAGALVAGLEASDADPGDRLVYRLQGDEQVLSVDEKSGELRTRVVLMESGTFQLRPLVTDRKFVAESQLAVRVENVNADCLQNSVYIKLNAWQAGSEPVSLAGFVRLNYLRRLREIVSRILSSNKKKYNLDVAYDIASIEIVGLGGSTAGPGQASLVEVLFIVRNRLTCLNSKLVSKLLNRRKAVVAKRMQLHNSAVQFTIDDISYNTECFGNSNANGQLSAVCSINKALQNCQLRFTGYNGPDLCETDQPGHKRHCFLIPRYTWLCDEAANNNDQLLDKNAKTFLITDDGREAEFDDQSEEASEEEVSL